MVKSKKSKKVSKREEVDNDSDDTKSVTDDGTFTKERAYTSSKLKESNEIEELEHNVNDETKENARKAPKKKKQSKKLEIDDDEVVPISIKTKKSDVSLEIGDGEDVTTNVQKQRKQRSHKSLFELLEVEEPEHEDEDHDTDNEGGKDDSDAVVKTKKTKKKNEGDTVALKEKQQDMYSEENIKDSLSKGKKMDKGGKKSRKKKNDDEEEIERMLAELELEYKGEKPKKNDKLEVKGKTEKMDQNKEVTEAEQPMEKVEDKKKKSRKTKKGDHVDNKEVNDHVEHDNEEKAAKAPSQKKKGKKSQKQEEHFIEENDSKDASSEVQVTVEYELLTGSKEESVEKDHEEEDEGDEKEKKKKDKTKKKEKDKEEKPKKGPGKKQVLLMQEALKKLRLEEEKRRLEEEAKLKAAEEAERLRLQKLQLEKERKERKKQREKERKEKLKAEGKLLTKTQKLQRARTTATLEILKAQGFGVPSLGEKKEKIVRRVNKVKKHVRDVPTKNASLETTDASEIPTPATENVSAEDQILSTPVEVEEHIEEGNAKDVKDAWDASSDSGSEKEAVEFHDEKPAEDKIDDNTTSESDASSITSEDSSDDEESESGSESEDSSDSEDHKTTVQTLREKVIARIQKRREDAERNLSVDVLRSPIVCVLGHVDTGKTKILDKIRHTNVQDGEAGGITQQIGATMVPVDAIRDQGKMVKNFASLEIKLPGLLIIDTPGHESFSNLRSRGSSLCDIAILVVDIMHGLEPQTIESINLLKQKKTPFIVALNKIDRLYDWKTTKNKDIRDIIKLQSRNTQLEFGQRAKEIIVQFAEQGFNAALFYENEDKRSYVSMVPTSASTGEGMGNLLALVVELMQTMLTKRLAFSEELQATVLELKAISGLGTTIDVILVNGRLREGDTMVLAGMDGPIVTQIRSLLMPQPLKELRVKTPYQEFKEVQAAQGVKITAKDLDKVIAGLNLVVAHHPDEIEYLKDEVVKEFHAVMNSIKLAERGVYVQASTLGSLEALLEFLRASKIPFSGIRIGPVVRRDVMKASIMLEHDSQYAVILAFDVKIERDAQELADSLGVRIFSADIIYHLFDRFTDYQERLKQQKRDEFKNIAVFPCKLRILPQFIFNSRDPIVVGVSVEAGVVKEGTPLCVPGKEFLEIGVVTTIEINHKTIESARKGQEVCIKVEPIPGESPKMFGRHFDHTDMLTSKISRQSIDACKDYFRDDLTKADWQLMIELKKLFHIL